MANDSYHRYPEDIVARIFSQGRGALNKKGIDHHRRFAKARRRHRAGSASSCSVRCITGTYRRRFKIGWQNRPTAYAFADYAGYVTGRLCELVSNVLTMDEISTFIDLGYAKGKQAPGLKSEFGPLAQECHYAVLGHGLEVQAIRAAARAGIRIGSAETCSPPRPYSIVLNTWPQRVRQ